MKVEVDEEGRKIITDLCDVALRSGGIQNLQAIINILNEIREEKPMEKPKQKKPK